MEFTFADIWYNPPTVSLSSVQLLNAERKKRSSR